MIPRSIWAGVIIVGGVSSLSSAVETAPKPVPAYVIRFSMNEETGVLEPIGWFQGDWPGLKCETEERLQSALAESEQDRIRNATGTIVVRAYDRKHKLIFRGIRSVMIYSIPERLPGAANAQPVRVHKPVFAVVVPLGTKLFKVEGWMPATTATFDIDQIAARFAEEKDSHAR